MPIYALAVRTKWGCGAC